MSECTRHHKLLRLKRHIVKSELERDCFDNKRVEYFVVDGDKVKRVKHVQGFTVGNVIECAMKCNDNKRMVCYRVDLHMDKEMLHIQCVKICLDGVLGKSWTTMDLCLKAYLDEWSFGKIVKHMIRKVDKLKPCP